MKVIPVVLLSLMLLSSCSWLASRRTKIDANEEAVSSSRTDEMVPKAQYDQLLAKYNELLRNSENYKVQATPSESAMTPAPARDDFTDVVEDLSKAKPTAGKAENTENTIDVFGKQKEAAPSVAKPMAPVEDDHYAGEDSVEAQITSLRKAQELIAQNQHSAALNILKELDKSPVKQIKVRAKFYTAELLFNQKEYDLAMQIYEEIINQYAFSGVVLKALGRIVVCTERLKLTKKQEHYYSLLHDFFEGT